MSDKTNTDAKELARIQNAFKQFAAACEEIQHYIKEGCDYFSVSVGPWEITYSEREESEK